MHLKMPNRTLTRTVNPIAPSPLVGLTIETVGKALNYAFCALQVSYRLHLSVIVHMKHIPDFPISWAKSAERRRGGNESRPRLPLPDDLRREMETFFEPEVRKMKYILNHDFPIGFDFWRGNYEQNAQFLHHRHTKYVFTDDR
jgi:hypothetical protein